MPERSLRDFYKTSAFYREGLLRKGSDYHAAYVELVRRYLAPESLILDLGAGTGASSEALAVHFTTVALDLSHAFLTARICETPEAVFRVVGDAVLLPFRGSTFQSIGAFELVEHVWDVGKMFDEVDRVLSPGGFVLIISPNLLSPLNAALIFLREARRGRLQPSRLADALICWYSTTRKLLRLDTSFVVRDVPERDDLHSDMDACYLASPVDLKQWFSRRGYRVRQYQRGGRTALGRWANRLFRSYAPTIYFVAQKPGDKSSSHAPAAP